MSHIEKCVSLIEAMDLESYEIILINDGSTDKSGQICENLSNGKKSIYYYPQQNAGVSVARNRGISEAIGDYVIFLDADDEFDTENLKHLLNKIKRDKTIDMAIFGLSFDYYHNGKIFQKEELPTPISGKFSDKEWSKMLTELFKSNSLSPIWNKIIKRSILTKYDLKLKSDMFLYEDLEYSLRIMANCTYILFCPDIVYHYRQSENMENAKKRVKRVEYLPELINHIELALDELIEKKNIKAQSYIIRNILLSVYLILVREKSSVSNIGEIRKICDDFVEWFEQKDICIYKEQYNFVEQLRKKHVYEIFARSIYTGIRHKIAVAVKNTEIYKKLRG